MAFEGVKRMLHAAARIALCTQGCAHRFQVIADTDATIRQLVVDIARLQLVGQGV
jgi:hypothetical protein